MRRKIKATDDRLERVVWEIFGISNIDSLSPFSRLERLERIQGIACKALDHPEGCVCPISKAGKGHERPFGR